MRFLLIIIFSLITLILSHKIYIIDQDIRDQFQTRIYSSNQDSFQINPILAYPADFGKILYGQKFEGYAVKAKPYSACEPLEPDSNYAQYASILLVKDVECFQTTKALFAQKAYYQHLILINDDDDNLYWKKLFDFTNYQYEISVSKISAKEGDILVKILDGIQQDRVKIMIEFDEFPQQEKLSIDYFCSALQRQSYGFIKKLSFLIENYNIENKLELNFHLYVKQIDPTGKTKVDTFEQCVLGKKYCANDDDIVQGMTGKDTIYYDLRFYCAYTLNLEGLKNYLKFIINFHDICLSDYDSKEQILKCFQKQLYILKIDAEQIEGCVRDTFQGSNNEFLEESLDKIKQFNVKQTPKLFFNNKTVHGDITSQEQIQSIICSGLSDKKNSPYFCPESEIRTQTDDNVALPEPQSKNGMSVFDVIFIVLVICIIIAGLAYLIYIQKIRREMRSDVSETVQMAVSNYMSIK